MSNYSNIRTILLEEIKNSSNIIGYATKVPQLKSIMVSLLTDQFIHFIKDIQLKAPKPTTFQIVLENDFTFILTYIGKDSFVAKVSGKQYNLNVAGEIDRASKAISELLILKKPLNTLTEQPIDSTEPSIDQSTNQPDFTPPVEDTSSAFQPLADEEESN